MELLRSFTYLSSMFLKNKQKYLQKKKILFLIEWGTFYWGVSKCCFQHKGRSKSTWLGTKQGGEAASPVNSGKLSNWLNCYVKSLP